MQDVEELHLLINICDRLNIDIKNKNKWIIGENYNTQQKINNIKNHIKHNSKLYKNYEILLLINDRLINMIKNNVQYKNHKMQKNDIKKCINANQKIKQKIQKQIKYMYYGDHIMIIKNINKINIINEKIQLNEEEAVEKAIQLMADEDIFNQFFNTIINNQFYKNQECHAEPTLCDGKIVWYKYVKEKYTTLDTL